MRTWRQSVDFDLNENIKKLMLHVKRLGNADPHSTM